MITSELLAKIFPNTPKAKRDRFLNALNKYLPAYGIDDYLSVCAWFASGGVETDFLRVTLEYHNGSDYEGRGDLGNHLPGDGRRYPGRAWFQTTGRFNYWRVVVRFIKKLTGEDFGKDLNKYRDFKNYLKSPDYDRLLKEADRLDVNFLAHPERLEEIDLAVESACIFWEENDLGRYARAGEFKKLSAVLNTGRENGRPNHWAKRNELYSLCKRRVPADFSFAAPEPVQPSPSVEPTPAVTLTPEPQTSKLRAFLDKYGKHCQGDSIRNIAGVALARAGSPVAALWFGGVSGKILLIVAALSLLGFGGYSAFKYRNRFKGWIQDISEYYFAKFE